MLPILKESEARLDLSFWPLTRQNRDIDLDFAMPKAGEVGQDGPQRNEGNGTKQVRKPASRAHL